MNATCRSEPYFMGWPNPFDFSEYLLMPSEPILNPIKISKGSIANIDALCIALNITAKELSEALALPMEERYEERSVPKRDGSARTVYKPHYLIRKIQRRINRRIFSNPAIITWPDHVFGSVPNSASYISSVIERDYVNCVRQHCGAKSIASIDIKNFFDNVHYDKVLKIFIEFFKYPSDVSKILTNICCKESNLVQGALTSSYLATLCLFDTEGDLVKRLRHKGLVYTRLVDDITISSKISRYDFSYALTMTENMLNQAGLPANKSKTKTQYVSMAPLIVHGLRVDFDKPRLPPDEPRRIRAAVKNLELLAASPGYRASRSFRRDFNRCLGRVNKLQRVQHNQFLPLLDRMRAILPLPSHADIERAVQLISRLESDYTKDDYKETYWFYKRFFVANERLNILKRSFPQKAKELRDRLTIMKPKAKHE